MNIQIRPIYELFVLYSALNYNGYDKENNPAGMFALRKEVRDYLNEIKPKKFNFPWHPYQYTKQILTTDKLKPTEQTNPDFLDTISYLSEFEDQCRLKQLWIKTEKEIEKELKKYEGLIHQAAGTIEQFLDIKRPGTNIVFTVNLLESYKRGSSITLKDFTYLITGPSEEPNISNFVHELIHSYLHDKNLKVKDVEKNILYLKIPEQLQKNYPTDTIIEESLVRALTIYMERKNKWLGEGKLTEQDKKLNFPELFLNQLNQLQSNKITMPLLQKVIADCLNI